jgi:hypothetical protein
LVFLDDSFPVGAEVQGDDELPLLSAGCGEFHRGVFLGLCSESCLDEGSDECLYFAGQEFEEIYEWMQG